MAASIIHKKLSKIIKQNFDEQIGFLASLVRARSSNRFTPEESKAAEPVEKEVAEVLSRRLKKFGLRPKFVGVSQARPNVVCALGPRRFRKSLMFNGHMDTTVPSEDYSLAPYSGAVRVGKLFGVGAHDMKASLSAYVYAAKAILEANVELSGRLVLAFVVDEEPGACSSFGTAHLLSKGIKTKVAIVGEPGMRKIAVGHRGGYRFKLTTFGEAVHTGMAAWERKEAGRNAIVDMARVIELLQGLEIPFKSARAFPGREPTFTFPVKIQGGTAINMVPDRCVAYGDVRLLPGNSDRQVRLLLSEKLLQIPGLRYELEDLLFVPSVEIDSREEIVEMLADTAKEVTGKRPAIEGAGPWNDAWMLIKRDIPTICGFGPEGEGAHGQDEWVDLESVRQVTEIYARVAVDYLGAKR